MHRRFCMSLVFICLVSFSSILHGKVESQGDEADSTVETAEDIENLPSENGDRKPAGIVDEAIWPVIWRDLSSPFNPETRVITWSGIGLTTLVSIMKDQISDRIQEEVTYHKPLGAFSRFGDDLGQLVPNVLYAGGFFAHYYFVRNEHSARLAMLMTKATLYSGAVTTFLKYTIREPRPNDKNTKNSFPSGHATSAFAFASVVGAEHGWKWGVPAYLMASFVGFSRINDNKHLLQDVIAGASVGISYGLGLYYLDHPKLNNASAENKSFLKRASVAPFVMPGLAGLSLHGEF